MPGALEQLAIGRVAGEDARRRRPRAARAPPRSGRSRAPGRPLRLSARAAAWPTLPAPMTSTGGDVPSPLGSSALSAAICGAGAGDDEHAVGPDLGLGVRRPQLAALPEPDDAQTRSAAAAGCRARSVPANGVSCAGSSAICRPRNSPDHVRLGPARIDAVGEVVAELVLQRQHRRRAAQLQNVNRVLLLDDRGDRAASGATSRTVSVMFVLVVSSQLASTIRARRARPRRS